MIDIFCDWYLCLVISGEFNFHENITYNYFTTKQGFVTWKYIYLITIILYFIQYI